MADRSRRRQVGLLKRHLREHKTLLAAFQKARSVSAQASDCSRSRWRADLAMPRWTPSSRCYFPTTLGRTPSANAAPTPTTVVTPSKHRECGPAELTTFDHVILRPNDLAALLIIVCRVHRDPTTRRRFEVAGWFQISRQLVTTLLGQYTTAI